MISVIVPVYNVENYIRKCIESILNQTYRNFELIIVDDGSTDGGGKLCDEYEVYSYVKVIHKENGGLSDARNCGLDNAKGEYITFIDSDDWIEKDFLQKLINIAEETGADLVVSQIQVVYDNHKDPVDKNSIAFEKVSREVCYRKMLLQEGVDVSASAKLYKSELFQNIRYAKGLLYEDLYIISDIIEKTDTIVITDYTGYYYLQRQGSIMYGKFTENRLDLLKGIEKLKVLMEKRYPNNSDAAFHREIYCTFHLLGRSILSDEYIEYSKKFRKDVVDHLKDILVSNLFTIKEKCAAIILACGLKLYKRIWLKYKCVVESK